MTETLSVNGRAYVLRKTTLGDQMRLMRLGVPSADQVYFSTALLCCSVQTIDGVPVPRVRTKEELEGIADRLDPDVEELLPVFKRLHGDDEDAGTEAAAAKN